MTLAFVTNDSRKISPPLQNLLCVVDGNEISTQGTTGELPFPSSTTRSLKPRRRLCGGESATDPSLGQSIRISLPLPYQKGEEECNSAKDNF